MSTPKSSRTPGQRPSRPPLSTGTKVLLAVLLLVPIVVPLAVPLYARESPELGGVPFFFWFQFALIPLASAFTVAAFLVVSKHENDRGRK